MKQALAALAFVAASLVPLPAMSEEPAARRLEAHVDPRVELLTIVFRLAGNPEYGKGQVESYTRAIDERFGKLREHAVVKHAAALRRAHGVSYDAVISYAVHLDSSFQLAAEPGKAARLDARWPAAEVQQFAEELRAFAKAGDAGAFFESQRPLYELTEKRMQSVLDNEVRLAWFDTFFGTRPGAEFHLSVGLANGDAAFGPSVLRADGREELHCVIGVWGTDAEGKPSFGAGVAGIVVHEFCHSYANPLVDATLASLAEPAQRLWPHVAEAMKAQAYADFQTMLRESLVRACVVRYVLANGGADAAKREAADQIGRSFHWTAELAVLLGEYERDREKYPALDAFMPRVAEFFAGYAKRFEAAIAAAPKVIAMQPGNGAADVDPALAALTVTFDRPMRDGVWSVVGGGPNFPKITGKVSYDAARRVLTIPVELKPSWSYEFWLNRGKFDSFQSDDGVKLQPVRVTFKTRAQ